MSAFTDRKEGWAIDHGDHFVTRYPLAWDIGRKGGPRVTVPAGFRFDVSIPRWLWWAASPRDRRYLGAAAVHDWLLADGWDVWTSGAQFRAALEADGVPFLRRLLMTLATIAFAGPN